MKRCMMMNFKKGNKSFLSFFLILVFFLLFSIFSFPDSALAGLSEDLIAQESWKKISLDLERASLINVLKVFSQQSGLNFIAAQEVANLPVTLYMENVPIRAALDKILDSYELTYELDEGSNIFVVKELIKPEEIKTITRVYALQYARINSSPLNSESSVSTSGSSLVDALNDTISSEGRISEDSRTNSLIITDLPMRFESIEEMIRKLDVPIPQVVIEVEFIDTTKSLLDTLGMQWSGSLYTLTLASRDGLAFPFQSWKNRDEVTQITTGAVSVPADSVSATLQLLMTDTDTRVLARPKILTLSNETAEIKITGEEAVGTVTTVDESGNTNTSAERYEVGVSLRVTPSVNASTGEITMVIEPTVSSVEASNLSGYFDPQERSAKVTVSVNNGETVIIGGLVRKDISDVRTKMPILGDIPLIGALFRHKSVNDQDRELLVFITPRIVKSGGVDLAKSTAREVYNKDILNQREQSDYQYRKEEIDKALSVWDK
ncbi:hypothetical protein HQ550_02480 [bacterium]|nr:hypothetical protein [bacterium]